MAEKITRLKLVFVDLERITNVRAKEGNAIVLKCKKRFQYELKNAEPNATACVLINPKFIATCVRLKQEVI